MRRPTFILILVSILCLASPLQVMGSGGGSVGNASEEATAAQQTSAPTGPENPAGVIVPGVYLPPINNYGTELLAFDDLVGKDLGILHWYMGWYFAPISYEWLPWRLALQVPAERMPLLMMSWIPQGRNCRTTPPDKADNSDPSRSTSLYDIADGHCDGYIRLVARELKEFPFTFLIRFAHEMNIRDQPWWVGHYNSDPQLYIDAYRRIHNLFASEGVTNVQWVWSPCVHSYPDEAWNSIFNYYPGDEYVDWVGLSAFNYAKWKAWPWWSFTELFDSDRWDHALPALQCHYAKPILLELASVEGSRTGDGTKAAWTLDAYQKLDQYPFVKAVVWFNDYDYGNHDMADFRIVGGSSDELDPWHTGYAYALPQGSGSWTDAYRTAVARDKFVSHAPPLKDITPPTTLCSSEPTIALPDAVLAARGKTAVFGISAVGLPGTANLLINKVPSGVTSQLSQDYLLSPWDNAQIHLQISPSAPLGSQSLDLTLDCGSAQYERTVIVTVTDEVHRVFLPAVSRSY